MKTKKKKKIREKKTSAIRIGKQGREVEEMDRKIRKAIPDLQKRKEYIRALLKYFDDTIEDVTPAT